MSSELEASVEEESRAQWAKKSEEIKADTTGSAAPVETVESADEEVKADTSDDNTPVDFE
jgi:DNA gyrase subunit A